MRNNRFQSRERGNVAYYHLPGLFEFYELYRLFLPLFYTHREYFYDWCEIGSISMEPRKTACGAEDVWKQEKLSQKCLHLCRSTGFLPV